MSAIRRPESGRGWTTRVLPREAVPDFLSVTHLEVYLTGGLDWFYSLKKCKPVGPAPAGGMPAGPPSPGERAAGPAAPPAPFPASESPNKVGIA